MAEGGGPPSPPRLGQRSFGEWSPIKAAGRPVGQELQLYEDGGSESHRAEKSREPMSTAESQERLVSAVFRWLGNQSAEDLIPREAMQELGEIAGERTDGEGIRAMVTGVLGQAERELRREKRTPREIIGEEATDRIVSSFGEFIVLSDGMALEKFMRSPQVGNIIGALLYETLFDFVRSSNLLGQLVKDMPILGPLQDQFDKTLQFFMNSQLGAVIKQFLGEYATTATERILELTNTPDNRASFGSLVSRILASEFFDKPIARLVPDEATLEAMHDNIIGLLERSHGAGAAVVDFVYDSIGDRLLGEFGSPFAASREGIPMLPASRAVAAGGRTIGDAATAALDPSMPRPTIPILGPKMRSAVIQTWRRFVSSDDGQEALVAALAVVMSTIFAKSPDT